MISQKHFISRRHFLALAGASAATGIVAACGGATPTAAPTAAPKVAEATKPPEPTKAPDPTKPPEPTKAPEPTATVEPTKAPEQYLIIGRGGDSVLLDAAIVTDGESATVCTLLGDSLTIIEGKSTKVVPWLAESWTSVDSKVWDFKLRSGVKFHDGEPLTAAAAKWNFDRWMNIGDAAKYRYPSQKYEYWDLEMASMVDKVEAVDDLTLRLTLKDPSALILVKLTLFNFAIASPKAIMEQGEKYGTQAGKPVLTGRFIFDSWIPNDKITVLRNDDWWGGKVKLEYTQFPILNKIIIRSIPDNNTRFAEFMANTIDTAGLAQTDMMTLKGNPEFVEVVSNSMAVGYIAFNQAMKPFDKVEVRQAWAHAVDWDSLITTFYGEYATRASCFQPPAILGHNPNIKAYEFDQAKAKELLAKAGLPDGFETDFWYIPVIRGYFPDSKALAEAMAADLAKVGIKLNLKTQDWGAYLAARKEGKFPVWALGWGSDNGDPDNFIGYHFIWEDKTKPNIEDSYNSPKLQALLNQGRLEGDPAKREVIYQEAEQIVHDDVPRIPVAWPASVSFNRKTLKGIHTNPAWVFKGQEEFMYVER